MTINWTLACTFFAAATIAGYVLTAIYEFCFSYRAAVGERLRQLKHNPALPSLEALYHKTPNQADEVQGSKFRQKLEELLLQSQLRISVLKLHCLILGSGLVLSLVAYGLVRQWWMFPIGFSIGWVLPLVYLEYRRRKRYALIITQLPKAIEAIRRAILSGHSTPMAFQLVADEFPDPIASEFRQCFEQQNLGVSHEACLRQLSKRIGVLEVRILAIVLLVQSRTGGSMAKVLENMANIVRKRIRLQQRIKALTSEGRMQALVLTALPFLAFAALLILAPDYLAPLLQRTSILYAAVVAQLLGILWIRHCVKLEN